METDFLNFHDDGHFGTPLYQNELLDDSQSSLLDIVGGDYSHQDTEYTDHSIIWEPDVERELNGDVAVIPMSSQINTFPKLSNSPPSKGFQKMFTDWHHITAIEVSPTEDLTSDFSLHHGISTDMLDCIASSNSDLQLSLNKKLEKTDSVITELDFSSTTIPRSNDDLASTEPKIIKPESKSSVSKSIGKNLELMKQVENDNIDLNVSFKSEILSSDELELDSINDNFDITSYVNGYDDGDNNIDSDSNDVKSFSSSSSTSSSSSSLSYSPSHSNCDKNGDSNNKCIDSKIVVKDKNLTDKSYKRKGCYEKKIESCESKIEIKIKSSADDSEDESVDVETISEQMPVLQARDVNSLWEQFEANEAANCQLPQNVFDDKIESTNITESPPSKSTSFISSTSNNNNNTQQITSSLIENNKPVLNNNKLNVINSDKLKIKQLNPVLKQPTIPQKKSTNKNVPIELIEKIKASGTKKSISVIPAMPSKKGRNIRGSGSGVQDHLINNNNNRNNKILKITSSSSTPNNNNNNNSNETLSVQLDHDYCSTSPIKNSSSYSKKGILEIDDRKKNNNSPDRCIIMKKDKCDMKLDKTVKINLISNNNNNNSCINLIRKNLNSVIDDNTIRLVDRQQIDDNVLKQKILMCKTEDALKQQSSKKNGDGKVMISLLKTNNRNSNNIQRTIVNTVNSNLEQVQNIIVIEQQQKEHEHQQQNAKKRKLNLEEYKKLRGDIIKLNSGDNSPRTSGSSSPMLIETNQKEENYQELIMKMASEILNTNVKTKPIIKNIETKLNEFVPPDSSNNNNNKIEENQKLQNQSPEKKSLNSVEIKQQQNISNSYEIRTYVSIGINTNESYFKNQKNSEKNTLKLINKNKKDLERINQFLDSKTISENENDNNESLTKSPDKSKLSKIITPILQTAGKKINSNSLITNITATLLQKTPIIKQEISKFNISELDDLVKQQKQPQINKSLALEHGEDKTVIIYNKNKEKPDMISKEIQTVFEEIEEEKILPQKQIKQYRIRRDSSTSSSTSVSSSNGSIHSTTTSAAKNILFERRNSSPTRSNNNRNSSSNSISSSLGSRWSRSRSRSRSSSRSEYSTCSSDSSRSRSRSRSISLPRRWHSDRSTSRSRYRYNRSRRRSRSGSYRSNYRQQSRSPFSRSRSRRDRDQRERESVDNERIREVEERRVIYVGKISKGTTKADLRRRFQNFGPITNVSVHFRDYGDNFGFVTFQHKMDAYEAVEHGNDDPHFPKYDISFGGRRAFCKTRYSDLDNMGDDETFTTTSIFRRDEDSFDILLREVQAKLRKRKV